MANTLTRTILFISSYAPLFLLLLVRKKIESATLSWILITLAVGSTVALFTYLRFARSFASNDIVATSVSGKDSEAMSYLFTYILPFLDLNFEDIRTLASLLLVFAVLGVIYVNSNLLYINPVLHLFRFHLFEIQTSDGKNCAIITRRRYLKPGSTLTVVALGDYVLMEKTNG